MSPLRKAKKKRNPFLRKAMHRAEAGAALSASWMAAHAPLALANAACGVLAVLFFDVLRIRRKTILENIGVAFPELSGRQKRKMGRGAMRNALLSAVEFARSPGGEIGPEWEFDVRGYDRVQEILKHGPAVFTSGHLGNWESPVHYFPKRGLPMAILYKPMHNPILDKMFLAARHSENAEFISTRLGDRELWRRLNGAAKRGWGLVFIADQDARHKGVFVPFFGRQASTATGPATLALRLQIPVVPSCCRRKSLCRLIIEFGEPIEPPSNKRSPEAIKELTALFTAKLEESIRQAPDQYFWFHKRWKTQPEDKA